MKKQNNYTPTLTIGSAEQKLVNQIMRESKGMMPTPDAVVYMLALEGLRIKLEEKREDNRKKVTERKAKKAAEALKAEATGGNGAKASKSAVSAE